MICDPAPKATPCTAAITGTASSRQPHATYCMSFTMPRVRSARLAPELLVPGSRAPAMLARSSPAQKARPSPDRTTTRSPAIAFSASSASAIAAHCSGSSAFILSGRLNRTSAMPFSSMVMVTRSFTAFSPYPVRPELVEGLSFSCPLSKERTALRQAQGRRTYLDLLSAASTSGSWSLPKYISLPSTKIVGEP